MANFDVLVAEAEAAPIDGWDFSWLDGRATEARPSWRYSRLVAERAAAATSMLDLQSGGGELLAGLPAIPPRMVATEGFAPNVAKAGRLLHPRGAVIVQAHDDRPALPFADAAFDLVTSRHPITAWWSEIARVLAPGGTYLSQEVGPDSVRELSERIMGPWPSGTARDPEHARASAAAAGLEVRDLQFERLPMTFDDIGAVVYFLRLVIWIVPGFSVERFRPELWSLHQQIEADGPFVAHSTRFLIEAAKPA